jgi:DNA-binding NarL/FixJ family response regulator
VTDLIRSSSDRAGASLGSVEVIRLLLVDDQRVLREPLATALNCEPDLQVVAQAGSDAEVRAILASGQLIDIAIVEVALSDGKGIQVIRDPCAYDANIQVLVLTANTDTRIFGCALYAGASGILRKTAEPAELVMSLRKLAAGEPLVPVTEAAYLMARGEQFQHEDEIVRAALAQLTPRERQVLRELVAGQSNEAIAAEMCVSWETVRSHVVKILHKLHASSRLHAAVLVLRHGFDPELDGR